MRILHAGGDPASDAVISTVLRGAGHALLDSAGDPEALIVHWSRGVEGVRAARRLLRPGAHLVLVSTHAVYPATPTTRPWKESDFHPADDIGEGKTPASRLAREAERALVLEATPEIPWTIVRPSIIESEDDPSDRTWWLLSRLLDDGPLVLPDDGPNLYRHVHAEDFARALNLVVGEKKTFGRILNVVGEDLLTPLGHALMLSDGLGRRGQVQWVPARMWRKAGLPQPMSEADSTSLIEASHLLKSLGFQPRPVPRWVEQLARTLSTKAAPKPDPNHRALELRLAREATAHRRFELSPGAEPPESDLPRRWRLRLSPGAPDSLSFETVSPPTILPTPVLKVVSFTLDETVERLLTGSQAASPEPLVPCHEALLELVEPGPLRAESGTRFIPLSRMPCGDETCRWCQDGVERFMGVDADGFAASHVTVPESHLVSVPEGLGAIALLAPALARLIEIVEPLLGASSGPVWVYGHSAAAGLAGMMVHDAGRELVHLDRAPLDHVLSPAGGPLRSLQGMKGPASLCLNLSGAREGESQLLQTAGAEARLVTPFGEGVASERVVRLPPAARRRASLEQALRRLERWSSYRDLESWVDGNLDPRMALDALLAAPFRLTPVGAPT